jgi:hypothetical protein
MDQLVTLATLAEEPFHYFISGCSYYLAPNSVLYLVTPQLDPVTAASILTLRIKGFNLVLLYLYLEELALETIKLLTNLREAGVRVLPITSDPDDIYDRAAL